MGLHRTSPKSNKPSFVSPKKLTLDDIRLGRRQTATIGEMMAENERIRQQINKVAEEGSKKAAAAVNKKKVK